MRTLLAIALLSSACLYERQVVREPPRAELPPPPPPEEQAPPVAQPQPQPQPQAAAEYDGGDDVDAPPAPARDVQDEEVFYERLSPYGSWTFVAPYGRVWAPRVGYGWRPYYYGSWVLTDWGWTFVSDDPWGWAGYHYGRWNWAGGVGWYWIPGRVWAPAWVSWRYGGGYAAWCPLGPSGVVFGYRHPAWVAVEERHFTRPISTVAVPMHNTAGIVGQAQPLTGPHATVAHTGQFGPPVARVQAAQGGAAIRPVAVGGLIGGPKVLYNNSRSPVAGTRSPTPRASSNPGVIGNPRVEGSGGIVPRPGAAAPAPRARSTDERSRSGAQGGPRVRGSQRSSGSGGGGSSSGGGAQGTPRARGGGERPSGGGGSSGGGHAAPSGGGGSTPHASGGHKK